MALQEIDKREAETHRLLRERRGRLEEKKRRNRAREEAARSARDSSRRMLGRRRQALAAAKLQTQEQYGAVVKQTDYDSKATFQTQADGFDTYHSRPNRYQMAQQNSDTSQVIDQSALGLGVEGIELSGLQGTGAKEYTTASKMMPEQV